VSALPLADRTAPPAGTELLDVATVDVVDVADADERFACVS
jgi:hypothetical protein